MVFYLPQLQMERLESRELIPYDWEACKITLSEKQWEPYALISSSSWLGGTSSNIKCRAVFLKNEQGDIDSLVISRNEPSPRSNQKHIDYYDDFVQKEFTSFLKNLLQFDPNLEYEFISIMDAQDYSEQAFTECFSKTSRKKIGAVPEHGITRFSPRENRKRQQERAQKKADVQREYTKERIESTLHW